MGRPRKKIDEDRLSSLPDEILHKIFADFTTKFYVQTSVFSKRWRRVWASRSVLILDCEEFLPTPITNDPPPQSSATKNFIRFVDGVIKHRDKSHVEKFTLTWRYDFNMDKANKWLEYVIKYGVREVNIDFVPKYGDKDMRFFYTPANVRSLHGYFTLANVWSLYGELLKCHSLQVLKLVAPTQWSLNIPIYSYIPSILELPSSNLSNLKVLNLSSLKVLHIHDIVVSSKRLGELISKLPVLENLSISVSYHNLEISAHNLKRLVLCCRIDSYDAKIRIVAPKLEYLGCYFDTIPELSFCNILDCVVEGYISFEKCPPGLQFCSEKRMFDVLRCLRNVKVLTLHQDTIQALALELGASKQVLPSFCNLQHLTVETMLNRENIRVICILAQSCPNLEKLVIQGTTREKRCIAKKTMKSQDDCMNGTSSFASFSQLKEVEILGFDFGGDDEFDLIKFVLKESSGLQKVKIGYEEKILDQETSVKMIKKLKSIALSTATTMTFMPGTWINTKLD